MNKATIIAVCGKGGVGKTSISALIVKTLIRNKERKVLAIDADPSIGLAGALGMGVRKTVDDIGRELKDNAGGIARGDKKEIVWGLGYEVFDAIEEKDNLAFLAIGRPEEEGCYCGVNNLLKDAIDPLVEGFDIVVIDGEAGIEQINRRVLRRMTHLFLVSDASAKGIRVATTIKQVADTATSYETAGLILNRIRAKDTADGSLVPQGLSLLGVLPEDDGLRNADIEGQSLLSVPLPALEGEMMRILGSIGIA